MKILLAVILLLIPAATLAQPLWTAGSGSVEIHRTLLDQIFARSADSFTLPVDGRELRINVEEVSEPNLGVTSVLGRFQGERESFFLLCRTANGATVAFFQPGDGTAYKLDHTSGRDVVRAVDFEEMGSCAGGINPEDLKAGSGVDLHQPAYPTPNTGGSRAVADDGSRHDILIGYTPAAEEFMGGWDFIRAEAQLAVDAANLTYDNSNITCELRLVHVMSTDYEEIAAWSYGDHLEYLWYPDDGHMDNMLPMRESVGADFVCVLIDGRDFVGDVPTCGIAPVMQADGINFDFEDLALSIVSVQCATDNWSLVHEVGHNRGCAHNREDVSVHGAYPYSYGHRYFGTDDIGYSTVMSYNNDEGDFQRIPYFSNPEVNFGGAPTGVTPGLTGQAHNALTHNNTAPLCATFRAERTFVHFGWEEFSNGLILFPFPSIIEGIWGSRDGGTIVVQNDNPGFYGVLEDPRSYIHDGPGSAVLGGN